MEQRERHLPAFTQNRKPKAVLKGENTTLKPGRLGGYFAASVRHTDGQF